MTCIAQKLADVSARIGDCERRIAEQRHRLIHGSNGETAEAALLLHVGMSTLQELRGHRSLLRRWLEGQTSRKCA